MIDTSDNRKLNRFPTPSELKSLSIDELCFIAKSSNEFKEVLIDFIILNGFIRKGFDKEDIIIQEIEMSVGLRNCLKRGEFITLNEISFVQKKDLRKIRNLGSKRLEELDQIMSKFNIQLAAE